MGQEKITGMKFTDTAFWNAGINDGLGGFQARFVVVHEGREQEAESLRVAFKSAGGHGTRVRDGVIGLSEKQIHDRVGQLTGLPGKEDVVEELGKGLALVQRLEAKRLEPQEVTPQAKVSQLRVTS